MNEYNFDELKKEFIRKNGYEPSQKELIEYMKNKMAIKSSMNSTNSVNDAKKEKRTGDLMFFWFVISVFSLIYFSGAERYFEVIIIFAYIFFVFAMVFALHKKKNANLDLLFILGFVLIGASFFLGSDIELKINISTDGLMFFVLGAIFFVTGIVMAVSSLKNNDKSKFVSVNAIVAEYIKGNKGTFACVYEYEYNGQKYKASDNFYTNVGIPEKGTIKQIYIKPESPVEIVTPMGNAVLLFLAVPFVLMGALFMFVSGAA